MPPTFCTLILSSSICILSERPGGHGRAATLGGGETCMPIYGYTSPKLRSWVLLTTMKDDFSGIPKSEIERFGTPQFVRELDPTRELPAGVTAKDMQRAEEQGYAFLEMVALFNEKSAPAKPSS